MVSYVSYNRKMERGTALSSVTNLSLAHLRDRCETGKPADRTGQDCPESGPFYTPTACHVLENPHGNNRFNLILPGGFRGGKYSNGTDTSDSWADNN